MEKESVLTEEHHRRPRSLGGMSTPGNTSYVPPGKHKAWHVLVGNMNAYQICNFLNYSDYKPEGFKIVCKFINGTQFKGSGKNNSKNKAKLQKAWSTLFGEMEFRGVLEYINGTLIDPSYHLYLEEVSYS